MSSFNSKGDKIAMDIISGSMYSLNFLRNISLAIFDHRKKDMTVREFHSEWREKTNCSDHSVPYSLGAIFGYLYCGILLSKEHWDDLLPDVFIKDASPEWGFSDVTYNYPKKPRPSIKDTIRRIRNALGHGNILVNVPHDLDYRKDEFEFERRTTIKFHDVNPKDSSDMFEIEISIERLSMLVNKFQAVANREVTKNMESV